MDKYTVEFGELTYECKAESPKHAEAEACKVLNAEDNQVSCVKQCVDGSPVELQLIGKDRVLPPLQAKYGYSTKFSAYLSIGFSGATREFSFSPASDSSYSEAEWDAIPYAMQREWCSTQVDCWSEQLIEVGWTD